MKVTIYTHNRKFGFFVHNNDSANFAIVYNSGAIYDSYTMAEIASFCHN